MNTDISIAVSTRSNVPRWPFGFSRRPFRRDESGQAIVEVALFLPIFVLLLMGTIDFGRYEYTGIMLGNGARAGTQYGSQNTTTAADTAGIASAAVADA
jgi:Flp pilus assembly protein TadG